MTFGFVSFTDLANSKNKVPRISLNPSLLPAYNADDVKTIHDHFASTRRLASTNRIEIALSDMVVGVLYGDDSQLSAHYKKLRNDQNYSVCTGKDFWLRLTGDDVFFDKLITEFIEQTKKLEPSKLVEEVIEELAKTEEIQNLVTQLKK